MTERKANAQKPGGHNAGTGNVPHYLAALRSAGKPISATDVANYCRGLGIDVRPGSVSGWLSQAASDGRVKRKTLRDSKMRINGVLFSLPVDRDAMIRRLRFGPAP